MELEALEAIFMDDFKLLDGADPPGFELTLVPEAGGDENHVSVVLHVRFPPAYPESAAPLLSVGGQHPAGRGSMPPQRSALTARPRALPRRSVACSG